MSDAAHAPAAADHDAGHHVNYMAKFYWLVALTAIEVGVALWVPSPYKVPLLALLSAWKAGIVLNHFMHLKAEGRALKLLVAFPAVLVVILILLFMTDGVFLGYAAF